MSVRSQNTPASSVFLYQPSQVDRHCALQLVVGPELLYSYSLTIDPSQVLDRLRITVSHLKLERYCHK